VTEQIAFDQCRVQGCAVQSDKRLIATLAGPMDGTGDQFLAHTGFALDQHGRIGVRPPV
jgi:hypothetical protein